MYKRETAWQPEGQNRGGGGGVRGGGGGVGCMGSLGLVDADYDI